MVRLLKVFALPAFLAVLFVSSGCGFPIMGNQQYDRQSSSKSELTQSSVKKLETEYAPPKIHIELNGENATITGGGITELLGAAIINSSKPCPNEEKNKLNVNVKDKADLDQEADETESMSKRESILITAVGALILLVVIIVGVSWFKKTAIGKATAAAVSVGTNVIRRQMGKLDDMLASETDKDKINDLLKEKARIAQNEIDYLSSKK